MSTVAELSSGAEAAAPRALDVESLRHHTEPSRFALAAVACSVAVGAVLFAVLATSGPWQLLLLVAVIVALLAWVWLILQLWRVRLLGAAVRVSADSFPELQRAVDEVRDRLDYRSRVDVYVVDKQPSPIVLTSYFGVRVLVVEGGAVADLTDDEHRPVLIHVLATYFGALKARHARWAPAFVLFEALRLTGVVTPFVNPWWRATVYTGDQIAFACCGDLGVSVQAVHRVMVGRDIVPQLRAEGLIAQSGRVRRSLLLRIAQLLMPEPHPTNRYLNLLAFAQRREPVASSTYRSGLDDWGRDVLDSALSNVRSRPPSGTSAVVGTVTASGVLVVALLGGAVTYGSAGSGGEEGGGGARPTPTEPAVEPSSPADILTARVPDAVAPSCTQTFPDADAGAGLVVALSCVPTGSGASAPGSVTYYAYEDAASMGRVFDSWVGDLPDGACADGDAQDSWTTDGVRMGRLACYRTTAGDNLVLWTHEAAAVLVFARSSTMSFEDLYAWWQESAALDPA